MRRLLLLLALATPVLAGEDPLRDAEVERLVWAAVDARADHSAAAVAELADFPGVTWNEVHDLLAVGRPADRIEPPEPPREDTDAHFAYLRDFPWEPGKVRTYELGDQRSWYTVTPAPDAFATEAPAVLLDLGAFGPQATAPSGWIVVRLHDTLYLAPDLGGAPLSLTAGTTSQSIVLSVLRDLERHVRFDPDRVFVSGFSRGGNAALYFGVHWPDRFAGIVPASGYYPVDDEFLPNLTHVAVLAAWGDDQGHHDANAYEEALAARLAKLGADVTPRPAEGRATDGDFGADLLAWAAARRREPLPRSFEYVLRDPRHRGAYWAEIIEVQKTGGLLPVVIAAPDGGVAERFRVHRRTAKIGVEVVGPNEIRLRARNVARLRLLLSPALFDVSEKVVVRWGERTFERTPRPSVRTLLAHFRETGDIRRLFPAELVLDL